MDNRLVVTVAYILHLAVGALFLLAVVVVDARFTEGQDHFIVVIGYMVPTIAIGLIWARNYAIGAPLLALAGGSTCWFSAYFFIVHDNESTILAISGDGATSYISATIALLISSFVITASGLWLWYNESDSFKSLVDGVIRPGESPE